ncbi:MAG: formate dehydrogenase subunit gamma [Acidiferrobacterales bacterium]|nr:formate dehydrogenase subunit gamma [Acidiferrobacterales bacterium]
MKQKTKSKTTMDKAPVKKARNRWKSMLWSFVFIVMSATILPTASYLFSADDAYAQVNNDNNQRANFWRAVREGKPGYSSVSGPEAGVFINNGGQNWRQLRNGVIANYGGWAIVLGLGAIVLFFLLRGRIKVEEESSGLTVPRWKTWERVMHWYTAILFVLLTISGLSLLFGRAVLIPLLGAKGFGMWANLSITVHNYVGPFFALGVFAMLLVWVKNNIPNGTDMKWFAKGGGLIGNAHPSAGKLNGGEKLWYWIVIFVGLIAVCGSGLVLIGWAAQYGVVDGGRATMQFAHQIHAIAAIIWIVGFFGHAYIGTLGTEGALEGMTSGRVSAEWAKQHHDLWYEEVKDQAGRQETEISGATATST